MKCRVFGAITFAANSLLNIVSRLFLLAGFLGLTISPALAQFIAYNDHAPGVFGTTTHSNATTWNILGNSPGSAGLLLDIQSGRLLSARVDISVVGSASASTPASNPSPGTPLHNVFNGHVDFQGTGNSDPVVQIAGTNSVVYTFTGLNPARTYNFAGSAVRGGTTVNTYTQRWTLFRLEGALAFQNAHTAGVLTTGLQTNEAAINTGINLNGDMAVWKSIVPAADGSFSIRSLQYTGSIPGGTAGGSLAYALTGFRLEEAGAATVVSNRSLGNNLLQVYFSGALDTVAATNAANYVLTNAAGPVSVLAAAMVYNNKTVQLTTASQLPNAAHWLRLNLQDTAGNWIAPGETFVFTNVPPTAGYVRRELFLNITNSTVAGLTNSPKFPNSPDQVAYLTNTAWPAANINDQYGGRMAGYLVPPMSGDYYFALRADDVAQLWFSPNDNPDARVRILNAGTCCQAYDSNSAGPFSLLAGQRYYFEALMKESTGGDYLYVAWKMPTNMTWSVVPGSAVANFLTVSGASLAITTQPTNMTTMAGQQTTFFSAATGTSSITTNVSYQWQKNGFDIPGATLSAYSTSPLTAGDSGSIYRVLAAIPGKAQFSADAVLSVVPDILPPAVQRVFNVGPTNVSLVFFEPVAAATATNAANYAFAAGASVSRAVLNTNGIEVLLTTSPLIYGSNYTLLISRIRDLAATPNTLPSNTPVTFQATPYVREDLGGLAAPSTVTYVPGGFNVNASGADMGGVADQGNFNWAFRTGDFDVGLRLEGLSLGDLWAKCGLMARESLSPGARYAATLATPGMAGVFQSYRVAPWVTATNQGSFPVNYPYTWIRLQRSGSVFSSYAGYDGQRWSLLGSVTLALPAQVYLGVAASSHSASQSVVAGIRDLSDLASAVVESVANPNEQISSSSRKTGIVMSEIMYKPAPRNDGRNLEYVEIYNSYPYLQDISNYRLVGDEMEFQFPAGTVMPAGAYWVVAAAPADVQQTYGIPGVLGPYAGKLKSSGTLKLLGEQGEVLLSVAYSDQAPWPAGADGAGHSLVLAKPSYGEADPRAWGISDAVGGSPGRMEAFRPSPLRDVVINEFMAHTDLPDVDFVELYNHGNQAVDLSGCILTDDADTNKFVMPPGTSIQPRSRIFFTEATLGFGLDAAGETVYFFNPLRTRLLDAVRFAAQENGVATGRWPDGAIAFYRLAAPTLGLANAPIRSENIIINELMYHPIGNEDDAQYVELYNRGASPVNLGGWRLEEAIGFTFPSNAVIAPGGYVVAVRNTGRLLTNYPGLSIFNTFGNFSGRLSGGGERIVLTMPDQILSTNSAGLIVTNTIHIAVDEVTWSTGGRWGQWADGGGSSLELVDPNANRRLAANWADSDETRKSVWTTVENTGVLDLGSNYDPFIHYAQIGLMDVGECLVDNLQVIWGGTGTNLVMNPDFESGLGDVSLQGCHTRSSLEPEGDASSRSLHIRASDSMWTGANSCEVTLYTNSMVAGNTATLRFRARWLHGWPEAIFRLNGNWLEATGALPVPKNLGTPGAQNSRFVQNAGPAVYETTHSPAIPPLNKPVVITTRAQDSDGVQSLTAYYRVDPATTYASVAMRDDGTLGDAVANDGVYSSMLPAQSTNNIVAFYISAADAAGGVSRFPALLDDNAPVRECLVMFGDANPAGTFGTYHLWITQSNATRWANLTDLSNESHDATFAYGNRVIYNSRGRFGGSPYHQGFTTPTGPLCHYKITFPNDELLLGEGALDKLHQSGNGAGDDSSLQREQVAHSFLRALGVPWLNRRYVAVYVNGNRRGMLMEDSQRPGGDLIKEYWPADSNGWLYKMQPWFEFAAFPTSSSIAFQNKSWCMLIPYASTGGVKKATRYRYNWLVRRTPSSCSDYTNVFSLIDAAGSHASSNYVANMENMADMENWMRVFAANHAAGNWDAFGSQNAQNLYGYLGQNGTRYSLMMWDFNIVLGNSGSWSPGQNLFKTTSGDTNMAQIYANPTFRRMYWRALEELVNGPLNVALSGPLIDAKYEQFLLNNLAPQNPAAIKSWLTQARTSIASQLAAENAGSFTVNPDATVSNNLAIITGAAPVSVKNIEFNGMAYPVTWTTVRDWSVAVPLSAGSNWFQIVGVGLRGQAVVGASNALSVVYGGSDSNPISQVVINEIMFHPARQDAEFVELYNTSSNVSYDLSGWELRGVDYTFPPGSVIGPNRYLVLANNRAAFAAAYGATNPVFDTFGGTLQSKGETLTLLTPNTNWIGAPIVNRVRYGNDGVWPASADGAGASLQLVDAGEDNWRPGNWAVSTNIPLATPGAPNKVAADLPPFPTLWLNEVQPLNVTGLTNANGQRSAWIEICNGGSNTVSLDGLYLSNVATNLGAWAFPAGETLGAKQFKLVRLDGPSQLSSSNELHAGFSAVPTGGTVVLSRWGDGVWEVLDDLPYPALVADHSYGSFPDGQSFDRVECYFATPGAANRNDSPAFRLSINEWMADNLSSLDDPADNDFEDWFEIYNPGTNAVDLSNCYLSGSATNPFQFQVPNNHHYVVPAGGYLLVWADSETGQNSTNRPHLHVNFKLDRQGDNIILSAPDGTRIDAVSFGPQTANVSEGRHPDGSASISVLDVPTPEAANRRDNTAPVLSPIPAFVLVAGQTLNYQVTAADSDQPSQSLYFALGPGAPAGAAIHPFTGRITWTSQGLSSNYFGVIVVDNGLPSLSATQYLSAIILPRPELGSVLSTGGSLVFQWPNTAGQVFHMESTDDLRAGVWLAVGNPWTGNGIPIHITNKIGADPRRFFRVNMRGIIP